MASTCTSKTATVAGTTPNFTATFKTNSTKQVIMLTKFTKSTDNLALTIDIVNPSISTTAYRATMVADSGAITTLTMSLTATANNRVVIPIVESDKTIVANLTFAGNVGSDCVIDFIEE